MRLLLNRRLVGRVLVVPTICTFMVAMKCKDRMHEIVKEEVKNSEKSMDWKETMVRGFSRMDKDITEWSNSASRSNCRCELQTLQCDAVGSTAVVAAVTPEKIVVSNYGDSRAMLCRYGVAIPLSLDHKVLLSSPLIQDSKSNLLTKLEALTNEIRSQSPESVPAALQACVIYSTSYDLVFLAIDVSGVP
ncbi:hypothetical protein L2E82_14761 [Cichorium intybus]|uniref:Uncharacterized protein n=1 Tax=Cichorium intybus TaxID=13427 RepID=A0ACB9F0W9_CICIN|nr:hypothetical protein L2E82_14761 [Cichorium intybus]